MKEIHVKPSKPVSAGTLVVLAWIGGVLSMIVYHFINIKHAKGLSVIDKELMQKLRDLEALKKDQLITAAEYKSKRREILSKK